MSPRALAIGAALLAACKARAPAHEHARATRALAPPVPAAPDAPAGAWPELAGLPRAAPVREVALPTRPAALRLDVGGPAIDGGVAVVASSQFGFLGVDYRRGRIAWSKPAGAHVAPPLVLARGIVLVGDCENPPGPDVLGCARVVAPDGTDRGYVAIRGAHLGAFAAARGPEQLSPSARGVIWRRGDAAIDIDLASGDARAVPPEPAPPAPPPGAPAIARVLGVAHGRTRAVGIEAVGRRPAFDLVELDAAGVAHALPAAPVPGIAVQNAALAPDGAAALAIRVDASLRRDVVAAYTADGRLAWAWPLPEVPRPDPIGLAIAPDAVLAFFDGDTLAVWGPPPASRNPTP